LSRAKLSPLTIFLSGVLFGSFFLVDVDLMIVWVDEVEISEDVDAVGEDVGEDVNEPVTKTASEEVVDAPAGRGSLHWRNPWHHVSQHFCSELVQLSSIAHGSTAGKSDASVAATGRITSKQGSSSDMMW